MSALTPIPCSFDPQQRIGWAPLLLQSAHNTWLARMSEAYPGVDIGNLSWREIFELIDPKSLEAFDKEPSPDSPPPTLEDLARFFS